MLHDDAATSWPDADPESNVSVVLRHAVSDHDFEPSAAWFHLGGFPAGLVLDLPDPKHQSAGDGFALPARPP